MTRGIVIVRRDGQYFEGCGYGGPGHPVPYWDPDARNAQVYKTPSGAQKAAKKTGGYAAVVELDGDGRPVRFIGFLVYGRSGWRTVEDTPQNFDPNDYEGNNGPLG